MASVLGIGGIFFKSPNPEKLRVWYNEYLNMGCDEYGASISPTKMPKGSFNVWSPFSKDSTYFEPSKNQFMFNLIVDNLIDALEQVGNGGATVLPDQEDSEYGKFGWFIDPDGNKVELWEPNSAFKVSE